MNQDEKIDAGITRQPMPSYQTPAQAPPRDRARKLHPMQWATYIIVIVTCVAVLYAMLETKMFIDNVQVALQDFANNFKDLGY
jgi:hypothetical protein